MQHNVPNGPRRCNCAVWAIRRRRRKGGYYVLRPSRHVKWLPHLMWTSPAGTHWWGYAPLKPRRGIAALLHGIWFRGHIVREQRDHGSS